MFLVDDEQAEVLEPDLFRQHRVGADDNIDRPVGQPGEERAGGDRLVDRIAGGKSAPLGSSAAQQAAAQPNVQAANGVAGLSQVLGGVNPATAAVTPVTGQVFTEIARGTEGDVEAALDAAHAAADSWGQTAPSARADVLLNIADRLEQNLEAIAVAEEHTDDSRPRATDRDVVRSTGSMARN